MQTSGVNRHCEQLRNDKSNLSRSLCDLTPHQLSTAKPVWFLLFEMLYPSGSFSTIPCPFGFYFYFLVTPSVSFYLSAAQSPTVTDPLQQAYAGVQHYAGDLSLLSSLLSHFLHLSLSLSTLPFDLSHQ